MKIKKSESEYSFRKKATAAPPNNENKMEICTKTKSSV